MRAFVKFGNDQPPRRVLSTKMPDSPERLARSKDLTSITGNVAAPVVAIILARAGLSPDFTAVLAALLTQSIPQALLYHLEHQDLPNTREGREAARFRSFLKTLANLIQAEDTQPIHLQGFIEEHPRLLELAELIVRQVETETDQRKVKHYAFILKNSLYSGTESDALMEQTGVMVQALRNLTPTDIQLLKLVRELQHPQNHPVHGATVPVNGAEATTHLANQGFSGGYLSGRLAVLVQYGLLDQHSANQPPPRIMREFPPVGSNEGYKNTYTLSPYGQEFLDFCILHGENLTE